MTRNLDLFRKIVIKIESEAETIMSYDIAIEGFEDADEIAYHCLLLRDENLIDVAGEHNWPNYKYTVLNIARLTNAGHNFCDSVKDDAKWKMAKSLMAAVKQVTLPVLVKKLQEMTAQGWDAYMEKIHSMAKGAGLL